MRAVLPVGLLLALTLVVAPAGAQAPQIAPWLDAQVQLERELLERAREAYDLARTAQDQAATRLRTLEEGLDRALAADPPSLEELQRLEESVRESRATHRARVEAGIDLRQEILNHLTRIEVLEALRRELPRVRASDPLTGEWSVRVLPQDQRGIFDLELDGTLVRGSFRLDGGFRGSLRGTFVGNHVRLERIDAQEGFDVIYEADLNPASGRLEGSWRSTQLSRPGPGGGDWFAERIPEEEVGGR